MDIVVIGSGKVATLFSRCMEQAGHNIAQVYSRDSDHAIALATKLKNTEATDRIDKVLTAADAYLVAVKDDAIADVAKWLLVQGKVVAHCSGTLPADVLEQSSQDCGVIWPLFSINNEPIEGLDKLPLMVNAKTSYAEKILMELALCISKNVHILTAQQKTALHLCAVMSNNFCNHLLALTGKLAALHQLNFQLLLPLIHQTLNNAANAAESQTGPAIRHDEGTMDTHLNLLKATPLWQQVYTTLTQSIQDFYR
ncbi:MAG: DUF2520 domain-containing protein [Edaphocola sp.]